MAEYERKWSEGKCDSNGRVTIAPGYVYSSSKADDDLGLESFFSDAISLIDLEFEKRLAKACAKWLDPVRAYMNEMGISETTSPSTFIDSKKLRDLAVYVEFTNLIDMSTAKKKVFPELIDNFSDETTWEIIERKGLLEKTDSSEIDNVIEEVFAKYPDKVEEHRSGKKNLVGLFMGEIMRSGKLKVNPKELNTLIREKLEI